MKELKSIVMLTESFAKLPSIGHKTAEKLAYSVLNMSNDDIENFANNLLSVKNNIHKCKKCGAYTEDEYCDICTDENREKNKIIVVAESKDIFSFEKLHTYHGLYHVLGGVISAANGVGVEDINFASLLKRINDEKIEEIIIATNPTIEGETTALYIAKLLEKTNVKTTRLAYGLPMGAQLEYADSLTLLRALDGRKKLGD